MKQRSRILKNGKWHFAMGRQRSANVIAQLMVIGGAIVMASGAQAASSINPTGRALIFDEEFDTLSVSADGAGTVWSAHTPWNGDFGQARFTDPSADFPFTVSNGILHITMRRGTDGKWQSGLLSSSSGYGKGFTAPYGYFEMRARLPAGSGVWPAFWMDELTPADSTANSLEVDVIEQYGKFPAAFNSTVTDWNHVDPHQTKSALHINSVTKDTMSRKFHTYGAEVTPTEVIFYFDRQEVWRTPAPGRRHGGLAVLVDLGLGGGWPIDETPDPSVMDVDYIRVYQPKAITTE